MPLMNPDPFKSRATELAAHVNPYVAKLIDSAATGALPLAFGPQLETFPGRWRERLAAAHGLSTPPARLVVEIGCHKGVTLMAMAAAHPDFGFIGLDITYKRVVMAAERAAALGLKNVFFALANAKSFDRLFAVGEADAVVIFFPDPWCKKKSQAKHRLVGPLFTPRLHTVLRPGGLCWFKTDYHPYFEEAGAALTAAGFTALDPQLPGAADTVLGSGDFTSTFERRFQEQNLPTYGAKWLRPGTSA